MTAQADVLCPRDLQHSSDVNSSQSTIDANTKQQLEKIDSDVKSHKDRVVKSIVDRVLKSDPKMHQNLKKVQA